MDKKYQHQLFEEKIYREWEKEGFFTPKVDKKTTPFTVLLPPPNANDSLHAGHAMYVIGDILCRWHRMKGEVTLFLPGTDHAGIETQYVFEKKLQQEGKSRFDFDRDTLYQMIDKYVEENRGVAKKQLKRLGFSLDWTREKYTMDPLLLKVVFETFRQLYQDGLIYRDEKLVNYCFSCGTAFSELEVVYKERKDPLFYMKYGPFILATTRPETKFGDTAVAVNPKDRRYSQWVGKEIVYQSLIGPRKMKVIADELVDPDFGTGVVKVTPAHDAKDFEMAQRHHLKIIRIFDQEGKLNETTGRFAGLTIAEAREKVVAELKERGDLVKIDNHYTHRVGTCYRCKNTIEPTLMPQWFVKIDSLAKEAIEKVKKGEVKIIPKRFEKIYFNWMENIKDWNISRQVVWGPRIPVWYCLDCNPEIVITFIDKKGKVHTGQPRCFNKFKFEEIKRGLQTLVAPVKVKCFLEESKTCRFCGGQKILQETDTFDTWFSSGQWPITTLGFPDGKDFEYFYPTSVLDTMWDILFFWVARMIMLCSYRTGKAPFAVAHMHSRVVDESGQKMSKSKGNVIDPISLVEKYGADALRMALIYGTAPASNVALGEKKVESMRNFTNKIWNAARFVYLIDKQTGKKSRLNKKLTNRDDKEIIKKLNELIRAVDKDLEKYRFGQALEKIYQFFWHEFCDVYIEKIKERRQEALPVLKQVIITSIKLLHPFAPFVTEAVYRIFADDYLIVSSWPKKASFSS